MRSIARTIVSVLLAGAGVACSSSSESTPDASLSDASPEQLDASPVDASEGFYLQVSYEFGPKGNEPAPINCGLAGTELLDIYVDGVAAVENAECDDEAIDLGPLLAGPHTIEVVAWGIELFTAYSEIEVNQNKGVVLLLDYISP